ncbi:unnamed protein product [Fusarium equiseti]|uniref:Uncharacterized protein n=1 Tax=Fusarium equiseti TaxID=61235 RepID=A0A8J2JED7_FUSEQ|nr:unnamed protein product [Fusarium equiseti]
MSQPSLAGYSLGYVACLYAPSDIFSKRHNATAEKKMLSDDEIKELFRYYLVMDAKNISVLALRQRYIYKVRVIRASTCFVFYTDGMHAAANVPLPFHTSGLMPIQMLSVPLVHPVPIHPTGSPMQSSNMKASERSRDIAYQ